MWLVILAAIVILVLIGRRMLLSRSLYELNLRVPTPVSLIPSPEKGEKIVIFAPHEDDETLGCAGYIQQAVSVGAQVRVVLITNGEYSELSVVLFEETRPRGPDVFIKLGYMRQAETLNAMRYLGLSKESVTFLGYPNQFINQMWSPEHWLPSNPVRSIRTQSTSSPYSDSLTPGAVYCGESLLDDVERVLLQEQPDIIITVNPNDIHVDHWPAYAFVQFALEELAARGETFTDQCMVYTYIIHTTHWPVPRKYRPFKNLDPPAALAEGGETDWHALPLTLGQTLDKRKAITLYRTQGGSIDPLLSSFARANELFGFIPIGNWPANSEVPSRVVLTDPERDTDVTAIRSAGDILRVNMARGKGRLFTEITTRQDPTSRIGFHLTIHAGGANVGDRIIVQYDWRGGKIEGYILQDGVLHTILPSDMKVTTFGDVITLDTPWPMVDGSSQFFLVRAWTTFGRRVVDQTAVLTLHIEPGEK